MANYTIIPLGLVGEKGNKKAFYFRIPTDEGGRFWGGLFYRVIKNQLGQGDSNYKELFTDMFRYMGEMGPGGNPVGDAVGDTIDYLGGEIPTDYRGRKIMSEKVFYKSGDIINTDSLTIFGKHLFKSLGGSILYNPQHTYPGEKLTDSEKLLKAINSSPVVGDMVSRFFKVSDYGLVEKAKEVAAKESQTRNAELFRIDEIVEKYVDGGRTLKALTDEEKKFINSKKDNKRSFLRKIRRAKTLSTQEGRLLSRGKTKAEKRVIREKLLQR
jgi:hypothetical protein